MDLKWLLVKRITLVALACCLVGSGIVLFQTAREARRQNAEMAELVGRQLNLQLSRIGRSTDVPERFPDWDTVASYALRPGQAIEFQGAIPANRRSSYAGIDMSSVRTPHWFVDAYGALINYRLAGAQPVAYRGVPLGKVVATYDPVATADSAWSTIAPLLTLSTALVAALCLVTYFVVDRALRPTKQILAGLNRLAQGDLSCRLPPFRLRELNRISEVFNALSADLSKATSESVELARRLVDTQEQERRHIARELHDEIAQKLAALNALTACVRASAQSDAPKLVDEAKELERMTSGLMVSLRRTLTYLRPQEIDDLGLTQSLKALVEQHNKVARGGTSYSIETGGEVEHLGAETSAHVYRIVQEALTNASKHANARNVKVVLTQHADQEQTRIRLSIVDDGNGPAAADKRTSSSGSGLIGMRERVVALSGKFAAGPLPSGGFGLQVEFPTAHRGA
jgi:signal transduction histidine kinase